MSSPKLTPRGCRFVLLAALALAGLSAQAQFARPPQPLKVAVLQPSGAPNEKAYRVDAARHIYAAYPSRILKGKVPALVYAIVVTETELDARGRVLKVRVLRQPAAAREVTPWVVSLIRRASPLPPPARMGASGSWKSGWSTSPASSRCIR